MSTNWGGLSGEQARLLDIAAALVKPGGHLVYAVCSLLSLEGSAQIAQFLARNTGWRAVDSGIAAGRKDGDGVCSPPNRMAATAFIW